jgi:2-methylcitrate dehydratase PrpD
MTTTTGTPLSRQLADYFSTLTVRDLPDHVIDDARWRLMDTVGVALAGSRMDYAALVRQVVGGFGGRADSTVLGSGERLPAPAAGFINASFAHGPDYDDTHSVAMVHIGCLAVPSALAAGELRSASGAEVMTALVAGAEIGLRIGAVAPHRFHMRGFHATGVVGPFVGAAVTGRLLGLDPARFGSALGLVGSQAAGLLEGLHDGSWVKRLHPGWSVQAGITAALLAELGFIGSTRVLEGEWGLFSVLLHGETETLDQEVVARGLGERWLLPGTTFKPYSNGAWNHSSMDAVAAIMRDQSLRHGDVERIVAHVPSECMPIVCEPREAKIHPGTPYHMKFSLPYSVAILAVLGHADVADYTDAVFANPDIADLAARVECVEDREMPPDNFPARVVLVTRDQRQFEQSVPAQRGGPGNPLGPEDHRSKFRSNAEPSLGAARTSEAIAVIESIWQEPGLSRLMRLLVSG